MGVNGNGNSHHPLQPDGSSIDVYDTINVNTENDSAATRPPNEVDGRHLVDMAQATQNSLRNTVGAFPVDGPGTTAFLGDPYNNGSSNTNTPNIYSNQNLPPNIDIIAVQEDNHDNREDPSTAGFDTLGLAWDEEANRGGAVSDSASVAISAITTPYTPTVLDSAAVHDTACEHRPTTASVSSGHGGIRNRPSPPEIAKGDIVFENRARDVEDIARKTASLGVVNSSGSGTVEEEREDEKLEGGIKRLFFLSQHLEDETDAVAFTATAAPDTSSLGISEDIPPASSAINAPTSTSADSIGPDAVRPGAYRIRSMVANDDSASSPDNNSNPTNAPLDPEQQALHADSHLLEQNDHVVATAYLVEQGENPPAAIVVHTYFGVERKRLLQLLSFSFGLLAIALGCVLGILLPATKNNKDVATCGPLCGSDTDLPDANREVFGHSCQAWDFNSTFLPSPEGRNGTCDDVYQAASYGCGCPSVELPSSRGCGVLCQDGSPLPDPDLMVKDINNKKLSCKDWELKAQFDTNANECVNYNAIGALCGCSKNEPHPDACGPLCPDGADTIHHENHQVWDTSCKDWNAMSTFLPIWYNNYNSLETCEEYYQDVRHGCACPGIPDASLKCGTLCQERRTCKPICQDGSDVPNPDALVRRETCRGWELHSRLEVHEKICPFYEMAGAQCGCENTPPPDACGPLCGLGGSLPDPEREVQGESCESWDYRSTFLSDQYGKDDDGGGGIMNSCSEYFSGVAYGCGCPGSEPPPTGCGMLCADGSSVPDPTAVVNAKTCRDLEILSLFETDSRQCSRYEIFGFLCGCDSLDEYREECFTLEQLTNETYYFTSGGSLYSISFGDDGYFTQIQGNNDLFIIGLYHGIGNETNIASYGGGTPCGSYGPRSGSVAIVEDEKVTEPTITSVIEPSTCVYRAELLVPKFCSQNETAELV
eukprot:CAMPEP_0172321060 /NCGR_PEP_ID=MMETSP1058-20130122/42145_1 /TAXON_ID=83371 /ORGANISM="Detonula confervacea, Strain CCMP 353" /LENGTH=937 /DNA_ID=CAMNT_0013036459 /DNA_START=47 /DNA_END=2860 /DNA_ORIENTATION=+